MIANRTESGPESRLTSLFRAAITVIMSALVFLAGCASEQRRKEPTREPGIFERPDPDSLH